MTTRASDASRTADAVTRALRDADCGEVAGDAGHRALYASDASNYRQVPLAVVLPRTRQQVINAMAVCRRLGVPVTCRGAGTSTSGQAVGAGVVLDLSRHYHRLLRLAPAARAVRDTARTLAGFTGAEIVTDPDRARRLWRIREDGAGLATRLPDGTSQPARAGGGSEAWPGWEDAAVPPERLGSYLREFTALLDAHRLAGAVYGHFGEGCLHVRINFDFTTSHGLAVFRAFLTDAAKLVAANGGSLSGEHGDGQARSELLPLMYPPEVIGLFERFKGVWDPDNGLNPGMIVHPLPLDTNLRITPHRSTISVPTVLGFPADDGDFAKATRRCVGVGKCRSATPNGGVMCPSYRVTGDEQHSTHHYRRRLRPASHYSMGWLPLLSRLAARMPRLVNAITGSRLAPLLKRAGGIAPERRLPAYAETTFLSWFRHRTATGDGSRGPVMLWVDSFNNHFTPQVLRAAVAVLEHAGYRVRVPDGTQCCGLTWITTGQLGIARRIAARTTRTLHASVVAETPLVGLEPSCTAALRTDLPELLPGRQEARAVAEATVTFAELIADALPPT